MQGWLSTTFTHIPCHHGINCAWQITQAWQKELFWISDCSVELSVTGETEKTFCTELRIPDRGTFSKCMNEFTVLSTEPCAFSAHNSLVMVAAFLLQVSPKAEGVALLPFKQLQSLRLSPQVGWPWAQGRATGRTKLFLPCCSGQAVSLPSSQLILPMDSKQSSVSCHFTQVWKTPECLLGLIWVFTGSWQLALTCLPLLVPRQWEPEFLLLDDDDC